MAVTEYSRRRIVSVLTGGIALVLAGCTSEEDVGDDPTPSPTPSPTPASSPTPTPAEQDTPTPAEEDTPTPAEEDTSTPEEDEGDGESDDDGEGEDDSDDEEEDDSPGEPGTLASLATEGPSNWGGEIATFSGTGQSVTDPFSLEERATVVSFSHDGDSNFIVQMLDDAGSTAEYVINEIGSWDGARIFSLDAAGEHRFDVDADGSWSLTVFQPVAPEEHRYVPPSDASGQGYDVLGRLELDGDTVVSATHDGESNFIVHFIDEEASGFTGWDQVFNEIGSVDAQTHSAFEGSAYVSVEADGNWTLEFE